MKIDPEIRSLIPPLVPEERKQLEANLLADGCRDALVVWDEEDILLDGHNRHEICSRHGIPFRIDRVSFPDRLAAMRWMIANQRGRRNGNTFGRCVSALKLEEPIRKQLLKNKQAGKKLPQNFGGASGELDDILAEIAGSNRENIRKVRYLLRNAPAKLLDSLFAGDVSTHAGYKAVIETQVEAISLADPANLDDDESGVEQEPATDGEEVFVPAPEFPCEECGEVFPCPVAHCEGCGRHLPPWESGCTSCRTSAADDDEDSPEATGEGNGPGDKAEVSANEPDPPPDRTEAAGRWVDRFDRIAAEIGELLVSIPRAGGVVRLTRGWPDRAILRLKSNLVMLMEQAPGLIRELEGVLREGTESEVDVDLSGDRAVQPEPEPSTL